MLLSSFSHSLLGMTRYWWALVLMVLLVACSNAPLSVAIPDTKFPIVSLPTGNMVLFYKEPIALSRPSILPAKVALTGLAFYQQTDMTMDIYGSASLPSNFCASLLDTAFLLCTAAPYTKLTPTSVSFATGAEQSFRLEGDLLRQALDQGKIWLGVQIAATTPSSGDLILKNMSSQISLLSLR